MLPTEFLRGVLGLLGLACAYMAGRTLIALRHGEVRASRHYAWLIRMLLCLGALVFRHSADTVAIVIWCLAALAFAAGGWQASHRKPPEDLTDEIFPE